MSHWNATCASAGQGGRGSTASGVDMGEVGTCVSGREGAPGSGRQDHRQEGGSCKSRKVDWWPLPFKQDTPVICHPNQDNLSMKRGAVNNDARSAVLGKQECMAPSLEGTGLHGACRSCLEFGAPVWGHDGGRRPTQGRPTEGGEGRWR